MICDIKSMLLIKGYCVYVERLAWFYISINVLVSRMYDISGCWDL